MRDAGQPCDGGQPSLESRIDARDRDGRTRAVDPRFNVALEASAGTGKTRVLVDRYVNLLRAGVDPSNILAITFTRKAAAEMRERIRAALQLAADRGEIPSSRWRDLRDRTGDIDISTIDAFCLSLLREFPLEADVDPGFSMADDTEVPRLIDESLDRTLRICRSLAREDEHVALVWVKLGDRRVRTGLAALLRRRVAAAEVLAASSSRSPRDLTVDAAASRAATALLETCRAMSDSRAEDDPLAGLRQFAATGPADPAFLLLVRQLEVLDSAVRTGDPALPATLQMALTRARDYFLTHDGRPRTRLLHAKARFTTPATWQRHRDLVVTHAPRIAGVVASYRRDLHVLVSRGVGRMFRVAETEYRRTLDTYAVLDFSDLLLRTLGLLRRMEEFSRSRYRLESRYHHVLVDEFQDTSRAQWELISLLVQSWGEGAGLADTGPLPPSIFIVGDRKQSIYRFRDADVSILADAVRAIGGLRPDGDVRRTISRSFRSVPAILAFVNDVCRDIEKAPDRRDAFRYDDEDRFPLDTPVSGPTDALGLVVTGSAEASADAIAGEVARLLSAGATVRDLTTGVRRAIRPEDIAILFRTRESHREIEAALARRQVASYVYKGLGFFDADEIKDVLALLWHLADPGSNLRAAAWMRSGFVGLSDDALRRLGPHLADALGAADPPPALVSLDPGDQRACTLARQGSLRWRALADRLPAAELLDVVLSESAYAVAMRGPRARQARENLKKIRGLVRRAQNRGYSTLARSVHHLDRLAVGDESNAAIDATDAVTLMTIHAAKGLEFPVVFVVNLARGAGGRREPIRLDAGDHGAAATVSVGDIDPQDAADEAATEREETKRLLYVALTRARDRLYLEATLRDGEVRPGRGSLAEVLPWSLLALLGAGLSRASSRDLPGAASRDLSGAGTVIWRASSGGMHEFSLCAPPGGLGPDSDVPSASGPSRNPSDDDFGPVDGAVEVHRTPKLPQRPV